MDDQAEPSLSQPPAPRYPALMTQPINLNRFRKQKARAEARRQGDENAAKHGRTKAQKRVEDDAAARATRHLDQHRKDDD